MVVLLTTKATNPVAWQAPQSITLERDTGLMASDKRSRSTCCRKQQRSGEIIDQGENREEATNATRASNYLNRCVKSVATPQCDFLAYLGGP